MKITALSSLAAPSVRHDNPGAGRREGAIGFRRVGDHYAIGTLRGVSKRYERTSGNLGWHDRGYKHPHIPVYLGREAREVHQDRIPHGREGAGLGKDVTFHSLRHTFASWYTMEGGGLYRPRLRPARRPETPMRDTPILIPDEPPAGLDAASQQAVIGALDALMKGRTSVVIAHHLGTIRHADVILVIKDFARVEHGAHEALLAQNGVYAEMQRIRAPEGAKITTTQPSRD